MNIQLQCFDLGQASLQSSFGLSGTGAVRGEISFTLAHLAQCNFPASCFFCASFILCQWPKESLGQRIHMLSYLSWDYFSVWISRKSITTHRNNQMQHLPWTESWALKISAGTYTLHHICVEHDEDIRLWWIPLWTWAKWSFFKDIQRKQQHE